MRNIAYVNVFEVVNSILVYDMSTKKYCNWDYSFDEKNRKASVKPNQDVKLPKTLFKYYALTKYSLDAIRNLYLYASHPYLLNDVLDCNKELITIEDESSLKTLFGNEYEKVCDIYGENTSDLYEFANYAYMTILYKKMGVLSFCNNNNNAVLWSMYTNNLGFCVEFDYNLFGFKYYGPFPIHYTNDMEKISLCEYGGAISMLIQTNVKTDDWKHENEWRLIVSNPVGQDFKTFGPMSEQFNNEFDHDRKMRYPISAIKGIYFGVNFFRDSSIPVAKHEFEVSYDDSSILQAQLLNHLTGILFKVKTYIIISSLCSYDPREIKITRINGRKFRIRLI